MVHRGWFDAALSERTNASASRRMHNHSGRAHGVSTHSDSLVSGLVREHLLEVRPRAAPAPRQEVEEREAEAVLDRRQILPELPCRPSHNLLASRYVSHISSMYSIQLGWPCPLKRWPSDPRPLNITIHSWHHLRVHARLGGVHLVREEPRIDGPR